MTIPEILTLESLYYEFEKIIGISPNVTPAYISKSVHPDCVILNKLSEDIDTQRYETVFLFD